MGTAPVDTAPEQGQTSPAEVTPEKPASVEEPAKAATPKAETPKAETSKTDTAKADTPKAGTGNGSSSPPESPSDDTSTSPSVGSRRPVVVVGAVAVVLAVIAVVAAFRPGAEVSNVAWVDTAKTREVTEAAKIAIETMHGYDYRTIDEDFGQIRELLTPERLEEFDSTADVTKKAAVDTRTVTEVMVEHIGATMLDDTHAEVAAYINVSATGDGIAQGSAAAPLLVRMEKSDGRWLVSEIRDR
ncbi:hypothetical protein [Rhodococcus sp. B50]|uniref:hypothetical protein n=1 Tax=Rhodococcus sp. B50 TaxID=2682847 RepID=UPI0027DB9C0E|nr:hypothetical protein [Rhodococcus sp. B50]